MTKNPYNLVQLFFSITGEESEHMNSLGKSITKKFGYSFGANTVSLLISVLAVSIFPKYMEHQSVYMLKFLIIRILI